MNINPMLLSDFYKISHRNQYPEGTSFVFANFIPRTSRMPGVNSVVVFGVQAFIQKWIINYFNDNFFMRNLYDVLDEYDRFMKFTMGQTEPDHDHIIALHDVGYLPLSIDALPEGTVCPIGVPVLTISNELPEFFWLVNYVETLISAELWMPITSATIAHEYRKILNKYALETTGSTEGVQFQGHDFSMRGMAGVDSAILSGMGHLTSFVGTDTMPAICAMETYYGANIEEELVGCSVPATEHSVQCVNGTKSLEEELLFAKKLITKIHPTGIVSMVSDTINLWELLGALPELKEDIMARDGKFVIRPDSGDPVNILCGDQKLFRGENMSRPEQKGVVEILWDIFGGTINEQGYKVLDSHIGAIYGDSITLARAEAICARLEAKGFASTNVVLGIGSFSYQYNTRDTFGFAMKTTYADVKGIGYQIFKDPITDNGIKKSLKGLCAVSRDGDKLTVTDKLDKEAWFCALGWDELQLVYAKGSISRFTNLKEIRERLA